MRLKTMGVRLVLASVPVLLPVGEAVAQEYFEGKTIELIIGYAPGSGNDLISRLVATHLGQYIPGRPTVVPINMPGAGSFLAASHLFHNAPSDGTAIGYISQTAATEELFGNEAVTFRTQEFNWIGRITPYNMLAVTWHTSEVKTFEDALEHSAIIGATGVGSAAYLYPFVMNNILDTQFEIVPAYEGTGAIQLAMERGEVEGVFSGSTTLKSQKADWLDQGLINILVQFRGQREAGFEDIPTILDVAPTEEDRQLLSLFTNEGEIGKGILAPPGVPDDVVEILRDAFNDMVSDPDFIRDAALVEVDVDPLTGDELQAMIDATFNTPPELVERAREMLER